MHDQLFRYFTVLAGVQHAKYAKNNNHARQLLYDHIHLFSLKPILFPNNYLNYLVFRAFCFNYKLKYKITNVSNTVFGHFISNNFLNMWWNKSIARQNICRQFILNRTANRTVFKYFFNIEFSDSKPTMVDNRWCGVLRYINIECIGFSDYLQLLFGKTNRIFIILSYWNIRFKCIII